MKSLERCGLPAGLYLMRVVAEKEWRVNKLSLGFSFLFGYICKANPDFHGIINLSR